MNITGWLRLPVLFAAAALLGIGAGRQGRRAGLAGPALGGTLYLVKILHWLRPGVLLLAVCLLDVMVLALLAVPFGPWWVAGLMFTVMLGLPAIRVLVDILVIRPAPAEQDWRVPALGLIPFQLNPHYLDPDPGSRHQGETRQERIEEFLEENDVPVLGLREGAWLGVSGQRAVLAGASTGRLFRRKAAPAEVPAGADLSFLLQTAPRFDATRTG